MTPIDQIRKALEAGPTPGEWKHQGRNWPLGASLSVTLLIIVTAALLVYVRFANRDRGADHG